LCENKYWEDHLNASIKGKILIEIPGFFSHTQKQHIDFTAKIKRKEEFFKRIRDHIYEIIIWLVTDEKPDLKDVPE
jgi:hypothetical protein